MKPSIFRSSFDNRAIPTLFFLINGAGGRMLCPTTDLIWLASLIGENPVLANTPGDAFIISSLMGGEDESLSFR